MTTSPASGMPPDDLVELASAALDGALAPHDEAAALEAKQRAEEILKGNIDKIEQAEALAELARAVAQIKMIQKLRKIRV